MGELEFRIADQSRFERIGKGQYQFPPRMASLDERRQQFGGVAQFAAQG
jgi:hypothetical protein